MGLYDREYTRYGEREYGGGGFGMAPSTRSMTTWIIIINVACFILNMFSISTGENGIRSGALFNWMAVYPDTVKQPWMWWQFLTYGFAHSERNVLHLGLNMLVLYFFGNTVERSLGRREFLWFYLVSIVIGGIIFSLRGLLMGDPPQANAVGASGGVQAVTILFAFMNPNATILLFFFLPTKAWIAAVGFAVINVLGALSGRGGTAYDIHLAGMAFAAIYFTQKIHFESLLGGADWTSWTKRKPKLRLHDPDKRHDKEEAEADRILEKIHRDGESSLTRSERKFMEKYSRRKRSQRGG